ncbi:unnamed protein product, partial [Ectocarpus sp. 12 AP-2014]
TCGTVARGARVAWAATVSRARAGVGRLHRLQDGSVEGCDGGGQHDAVLCPGWSHSQAPALRWPTCLARLNDYHMASPAVDRGDNGYPEPLPRESLARRVKKSWDAVDADSIRSKWKAGLLLLFDGSKDEAWANKELGSDAYGPLSDVDASEATAGADESGPVSSVADLLEVLEILDHDDTAVEVLEISDDEDAMALDENRQGAA